MEKPVESVNNILYEIDFLLFCMVYAPNVFIQNRTFSREMKTSFSRMQEILRFAGGETGSC